MFPIFHHPVHHDQIQEHPYGENDLFEWGFGNEEREHNLPGKVESDCEERHAIRFAAERLACKKDVAQRPQNAANLEEGIAGGDNVGGDVRWRNVIGAHVELGSAGKRARGRG